MVRIAMVSTPSVAVPPRGYGGTELVVHELVRGLTAAGHRVTLFATGDSAGSDVRYVYPRPVWPPDPEAELRHCAAAARAVLREQFDVVHAHLPGMVAVAPEIPAPLVYTIHHDRQERLTRLYRRRPGVHLVAISARQAQLEPDLTCHVIHHGLDPERHPPGRGEGGYALFLGRLAPCKGPDLAIAAAAAAGVPLRLAGRVHAGDRTPGWEDRLQRALHGHPGARLIGPVEGEAKVILLASARALLMPLRWEEPFGLVMIEAMLCGTPVIAFRRGAAPEVIDEGVTGFLVDDEHQMASALSRVDALDRTACRRRACARFSAARMVRDYERVYAAAVAGARRGAREEPTYAH